MSDDTNELRERIERVEQVADRMEQAAQGMLDTLREQQQTMTVGALATTTLIITDSEGRPVMALYANEAGDGELELSDAQGRQLAGIRIHEGAAELYAANRDGRTVQLTPGAPAGGEADEHE